MYLLAFGGVYIAFCAAVFAIDFFRNYPMALAWRENKFSAVQRRSIAL